MFEEYQKRVLQSYREMKAGEVLSYNLTIGTPAKMKAECLAVCDKRYRKSDDRTISSFFGQQDDLVGYLQVMKKTDPDKFRPLCNFLKENTGWTEPKNIELLAWLIDFQQRPYNHNANLFTIKADIKQEVDEAINGNPNVEEIKNEDRSEPEGVVGESLNEEEKKEVNDEQLIAEPEPNVEENKIADKTVRGQKKPNVVALLLAFVIVGVGFYFLNRMTSIVASGNEGCMYWAEDHYQPSSCSQKRGDIPLFALDSIKLARFKKITRPDTITKRCLGKLWYIKIDNKLEYFTAAGFHPVHIERRLKPISERIIYEYIPHK